MDFALFTLLLLVIRILQISLGLLILAPFVVMAQLIVHDVHFYVRPLNADSNLSFSKRLSADEFRELFADDGRLDVDTVKDR